MHMNLSKLQKTVKTGETSVLHSMGSQRVGHDLATGQHSKVYIKRTELKLFPGGTNGQEPTYQTGDIRDLGVIPVSG